VSSEEITLRRIAALKASPILFARTVLGIDPWEGEGNEDSQSKFLSLVTTHKRLAVRSGHKTGKSAALATIALWAYATEPGTRVVLVAPTWRQVEEVVWREVRTLWKRAEERGFAMAGRLYDRADHGAVGPGGRQIMGISTDDPDRFSGISGRRVFYIVDEASGVDDAILEAIEGNAAGGAWIIFTGNPTRTEGGFYRAFHEEAPLWRTLHISSERTPNARTGEALFPGLATRDWVQEKRTLWHPHDTHPLYSVRVRGDFPAQGSTSVFSLQRIDEAIRRWTPQTDASLDQLPLHIGVDCARFGDDKNAVAIRRGKYVFPIVTFGGLDSIGVAGKVRKIVHEKLTSLERFGSRKKPRVQVDVIGIGAGVFDQLRTFDELEVVPVNVGAGATEETYSNLRAQVYFAASEWVADGGTLPDDNELKAELLAPQYAFDQRGRIKIEPKDDIKKRIGRSPDKADALTLCVYQAPVWSPKPFALQGL
jgi:phage terminase large subunit